MAEKKSAPSKREQFEGAVYELGLTLIDEYRAGKCRDREKTLSSIIDIFRVSQSAGSFLLEGKSNGI